MDNSIDIVEVKKRIPQALYDCISEKLRNDQCLSIWQYCLECIEEMADAWEEVNGEDLIWIPGHYEKKEKLKNSAAESLSADQIYGLLQNCTPDIYANTLLKTNLEQTK